MLFVVQFSFSQKKYLTKEEITKEIKNINMLALVDPNKAIDICLYLRQESKKIGYEKGLLISSTRLMILYFQKQEYKKLIDISDEAEKVAKELNDNPRLADVYRLKGTSYCSLGLNHQGIKELRKSLVFAKKVTKKDVRYYQEALVYQNISSYYGNIKASKDSVLLYAMKSLNMAKKMSESKDVINFKYQIITFQNMSLAVTYNNMNKKEVAEKYFLKSMKIYESKKYLTIKVEEVILLEAMASFYENQKQYDKSIEYGRKGLMLEKEIGAPNLRRDIYESMFKSYMKGGKKDSAVYYMNAYTSLRNSVKETEKKAVDSSLKKIISEKDKDNENNLTKILLSITGIFVVLSILGVFYWKRNNKILRSKYEVITQELEKETSEVKKDNLHIISNIDTLVLPKNSINITDGTTIMILNGLTKFEESKKFIRQDISLSYLANLLSTNTKYLSYILKEHKEKSFNNYINGLRIQYLIGLLHTESKYRDYKISYLAECSGFASREVFATVFKKETGITPSYFINTLKEK